MNNALKKYNELKNDLITLELYIENNSVYKMDTISKIICNLMSVFEGIEYEVTYRYDNDNNEKCVITEKSRMNYSLSFIMPSVENMKHKDFIHGNADDYCFLPPSEYKLNNIPDELSYIQDFADFIFKYKTNTQNTFSIKKCLAEFLINTKNNQGIRKTNRKRQNNSRKNSSIDKSFIEKCMVDRKSLFNNIIYIINNYDNIASARKYTYNTREKSNKENFSNWYKYEVLEINSYFEEIKLEECVDYCEVDDDLLEIPVLDEHGDGKINFFKVKNSLSKILYDNSLLKKYMENIEKILLHKNEVSIDELNELYLELTNNKVKKFV